MKEKKLKNSAKKPSKEKVNDKLSELEKELGLKFKDKILLQTAMTHRSYINENQKRVHNERLEFLGDAVLELCSTEFLYNKFPEKPEGELTSIRSALVKGKHLAQASLRIGLGDYLLLSRGEEKSGGRSKDYILANAMEALIGAIYLDRNFKAAQTFVMKNILSETESILSNKKYIDNKSLFQEKAQEIVKITPNYKKESEEGPDHQKLFVMAVYLGDKKIAVGKGTSKKEAEMQAAKEGLKKMGWEK